MCTVYANLERLSSVGVYGCKSRTGTRYMNDIREHMIVYIIISMKCQGLVTYKISRYDNEFLCVSRIRSRSVI
jgi:hypothetical protein